MFHHYFEGLSLFFIVLDEFCDSPARYAFVLHAEFCWIFFVPDDFGIDGNVECDLIVLSQKVDLFALFGAVDYYEVITEPVI